MAVSVSKPTTNTAIALTGYAVGFGILAATNVASYLYGSHTAAQLGVSIAVTVLPLVVIGFFTWAIRSAQVSPWLASVLAYAVFFSVSGLLAFGLMGTLNGLVATSGLPWLFGFSFYTASFAFHIYKKSLLTRDDVLVSANPLLLVTGPINTGFADLSHHSWRWRMNYFLPHLLVGLGFFIVIGLGLVPLLSILEQGHLLAYLAFGAFLELYIYFNFAGLSLVVFALLGLAGLKVPLNFQQPFSGANLIEFWRGWHLSLSHVLKTLFFIPVRGRFGPFAAITATFLASALWHGVTIPFVLWGLLHGTAFYLTSRLLKARNVIAATLLMPPVLVVARAVFGTPTFAELIDQVTSLPNRGDVMNVPLFLVQDAPIPSLVALALAVTVTACEVLLRRHRLGIGRNYKFLRTPGVLVIVVVCLLALTTGNFGEVVAAYGQR